MKVAFAFLLTAIPFVTAHAATPEDLAALVARSPLPTAGDYQAIGVSENRFVAVSSTADIIVGNSAGTEWTKFGVFPDASPSLPIQAIVSNPSGTLFTSFSNYYFTTDLENFSSGRITTGGSRGLAAAAGTDRFVAVGNNGGIALSTDGTTWNEASTIPISASLSGVAFGDGIFVAGSEEGQLLRSTDGDVWTTTFDGIPEAVTTSNSFIGVSYANGFFFAGAFPDVLYSSPDGTTWTRRDLSASGITNGPSAVAHDGARYVIAHGFRASSTTNFTTFEDTNFTVGGRVGQLAQQGGIIATAGQIDGFIGSLTPGGTTWRDGRQRLGGSFGSVVFSGGRFLIAENQTGRIFTSTTGAVWTIAYDSDERIFSDFAVGNGQAAVLLGDGTIVSTADGGNTFIENESAVGGQDIVFENGLFLVFGRLSTIFTGADATTTFTANIIPDSFSNDFFARDITYGDGIFVAVTFEGSALTSPDAATWTLRTTGVEGGRDFTGIEYVGNRFTAFRSSGVPLSSEDGITWAADPSAGSVFATSTGIDPDLGLYYIGSGSSINYYPDPFDLAEERNALLPTRFTPSAFAEGNGSTVVVGANGLILSTGREPTGYEAWVLSNFPLGSALTDPTDDFDGDGQQNLIEYARGTDPKTSTPNFLAPPVQTAFGPSVTYTQRAAAPGVASTVEYSSDLIEWSSAGIASDTVPTTTPGFEAITAQVTGVPGTSNILYLRIRWFLE